MPEAWKEALGLDWKRVHETLLHTLGNLTLTGYNSEYRDHSFAIKRDMDGGFASSPLKLNKGLGQATSWNEGDITARAARLAQEAVTIWLAPDLADDILQGYSGEERTAFAYSIQDHPNLSGGSTRRLFEAFRREVMALDAGVKEEFLKLYVAYKAETNFADVIPLAHSIRVTLNMRFSDIIDPRGRCRDVSNLGRWGNGDVEIKVENLEDIPYVVGLARQALELQIGGENIFEPAYA